MTIAIDYDAATDVVTIEGVKYSPALFRAWGKNGLAIGQAFRIIQRAEDGLITLEMLPERDRCPDGQHEWGVDAEETQPGWWSGGATRAEKVQCFRCGESPVLP